MAPNMDTDTEDQKVKALMEKYPDHFEILTERNKVLCKLTKHELPLNAAAMQTYIDGKKFQSYLIKVKKPTIIQKLDDKYKEYFIPSKRSASRLFCTLTRKEINKQPHEIERYITGYKFLKAVKRNHERKAKGMEIVEETNQSEGEDDVNGEGSKEINDVDDGENVPFYALSSEGEEGEEGEEGDDIDEDDIIIDDDVTLEGVPNDIEMEATTSIESKVEDVLGVHEAIEENLTKDENKKGKKRKTKIEKLKKDKKKSKKLKPAGM